MVRRRRLRQEDAADVLVALGAVGSVRALRRRQPRSLKGQRPSSRRVRPGAAAAVEEAGGEDLAAVVSVAVLPRRTRRACCFRSRPILAISSCQDC
jgi:hypothetical protein